ncbi:hypothetical protein ACSLOV_24720, partial [Escherichia coli]
MDISTLISSSGRLQLSAAESKIPWEELAFSQRMLENHLSQDDDWASRRQIVIEQQVGWIARQLLVGARTLDIGCDPNARAEQPGACPTTYELYEGDAAYKAALDKALKPVGLSG